MAASTDEMMVEKTDELRVEKMVASRVVMSAELLV